MSRLESPVSWGKRPNEFMAVNASPVEMFSRVFGVDSALVDVSSDKNRALFEQL
jgi:hypothetical protein